MKTKQIPFLLIVLSIFTAKAQNTGVTDASSLTPQSILHVHKNAATGQIFQLTNTTSGADATTKGFVIDFDAAFNAAFKNQFQNVAAGFSFWTYTNGGSLTEKLNIQNDGTLRLLGSSSGYVGFKAAAAAGSVTYTLPSVDGGAGQVLSTNGSGTLSWATRTTGSGEAWTTLGNAGTNGATNFIGTTDGQDFVIKTNNASRAKITSAGVTTIGDGTNQTKFEADGTQVFQGNATCFNDLSVPGLSGKIGAAAFPDLVAYKTTLSLYGFAKNSTQSIYFVVQMPHDWKEGSTIYPHVHWTGPTDAGTDLARTKVVWAFEYTWANVASNFAAPDTLIGYDPIAPVGFVTADEHAITSFSRNANDTQDVSGISASGKTISSVLICRLTRYGTHAKDDYDDNALLLQIDFHYEIDMAGSHSDFTK